MVDSAMHHRVFVVRGRNIDIYDRSNVARYVTSMQNLTLKDGKTPLLPHKMMLYKGDTNMLLLNSDADKHTSVFQLDVERGKVVEEYRAAPADYGVAINQTIPTSKFTEINNDDVFGAMNRATLFAMDPRIKGSVKAVGDLGALAHTKSPGFSCAMTTAVGSLAVGSEKGEVRLLSGIPGLSKANNKRGEHPKIAKTMLEGYGDPIRGLDVTADGKYVLATCEHYLLVYCTVIPDDPSSTGFTERMGDQRQAATRLQLSKADVAAMGGAVDFTPARFNTGKDGETWIVTSTGSYLFQWNFKEVAKNHQGAYTMKKLQSGHPVVDAAFINLGRDGRGGTDAPIVAVLPDAVRFV